MFAREFLKDIPGAWRLGAERAVDVAGCLACVRAVAGAMAWAFAKGAAPSGHAYNALACHSDSPATALLQRGAHESCEGGADKGGQPAGQTTESLSTSKVVCMEARSDLQRITQTSLVLGHSEKL